jgi:hypothetical protein
MKWYWKAVFAEGRPILFGRAARRITPADGNLHAQRRLNIKITPAFACGERRLRGENMV